MARNQDLIKNLMDGVKDISRPNYFEVELSSPSIPTFAAYTLTRNLIKSIQVPSTSLGSIEIKRMGKKLVLPGSVDHSDVNLSVFNDIDGEIRNYFLDWQRVYIKNINEGKFGELKDIINGYVEIYQLDVDHERMQLTILKNAYPRIVGEIEQNHEIEDTLGSFNVTFAYSYSLFSNRTPDFSDIK